MTYVTSVYIRNSKAFEVAGRCGKSLTCTILISFRWIT